MPMNNIQGLLNALMQKGWTLAAIANELAVSYSAVRKWSAGMRYPSNAPTVEASLSNLLVKWHRANPVNSSRHKGTRMMSRGEWAAMSDEERLAGVKMASGMFRHVAPGVDLVKELSEERIREAEDELKEILRGK